MQATTRAFVARVLECRLIEPQLAAEKPDQRVRIARIVTYAVAFAWLTFSTLHLVQRVTVQAIESLTSECGWKPNCINVVLARSGPMMRSVFTDNGVYPLILKVQQQCKALSAQCLNMSNQAKACALDLQCFISKKYLEDTDQTLTRVIADLRSVREAPMNVPKHLEMLAQACRRGTTALRATLKSTPQRASIVEAVVNMDKFERHMVEVKEDWERLLSAKSERKRFAMQLNTWLLEQIPFRFTRGITRQAPNQAAAWIGELLLFAREAVRVSLKVATRKTRR